MSEPAAASTGRAPWWPIFLAIIAAVSAFAVTMGMTYPLLALTMERWGISPSMIGANAAMSGVGLVVSAALMPRIVRRIGLWRCLMAGALTTCVLLLALASLPNYWAWFPLRLGLAIGANMLFIGSETWLGKALPDDRRGRLTAVYTTCMSGFFGLGPLLLALLGSEGWLPYLAGAALIVCAGLVIATVRGRDDHGRASPSETEDVPSDAHPTGTLAVMALVPVPVFATLVFGIYSGSQLSLWPSWGLERGMSAPAATTALSIAILGNVLLQVPIGWLADRFGTRRAMLGCAVLTVTGAAVLSVIPVTPWPLWPFLFLWGGSAFGVYTITLTALGAGLKGERLVAAYAAVALAWGAGLLLGPVIAGAAIQLLGAPGLPLVMGTAFAALLIVALTVPMVRRPAGDAAARVTPTA